MQKQWSTEQQQPSKPAEEKELTPKRNGTAQPSQASENIFVETPPSGQTSTETQESMAEPELLALIIELRLRAGRGSKGSKASTYTSAVDTLDLSHRKIEKLPYEMVNIIKDDVVR